MKSPTARQFCDGTCIMLKGEVFVGGAVQVKDVDDRIVHCDFDSMDLRLLVGIHFEIGGCNVVSD